MIERFDSFLARPVSMRSLGIVRILVGAIALMHLWPFVTAALDGDTYRDHVYHAYFAWYPELSGAAYTTVLVVGCVAAVAMSLGLWSAVSTRLTFGVVAYNLLLSTTHMHNNVAYLVIVLGLLACAPCGRALSVDWLWRRWRGLPEDTSSAAWPLWLLRFECAAIYGASGVSKLLDPDWFGGTVTWGRMVEVEAQIRSSAVPGFVADLLVDRSFHSVAAKLIIATELFIAGGLWWRRTRVLAVIAAIGFHIAIQLTANVQIFSYLGVAVLFVWADPAVPWLRIPGRRTRRVEGAHAPAAAR